MSAIKEARERGVSDPERVVDKVMKASIEWVDFKLLNRFK